jgi:hypothetical protein
MQVQPAHQLATTPFDFVLIELPETNAGHTGLPVVADKFSKHAHSCC